MLASMESLLTLGTCRELPVVGFVGSILVTGIIVSQSVVFLTAGRATAQADKQQEDT
jgi:hypothetical protein